MNRDQIEDTLSYEIPARIITGSPSQILEEIDDMMEALQTVREVVVQRAPKPAVPPEGLGWRGRLARALHLKT